MTLTDATVYADILANPDDDGPRRVYADYLIERDDPRGELIVLQCELASCAKDDPRRKELEARQTQLSEEARRRWCAELGLPRNTTLLSPTMDMGRASSGCFALRRGIVEELSLDLDDLVALGEGLTRMPLRKLHVVGIDDAGAAKLAQLPVPAGVTYLRVRKGRLGSAGAAALADATSLAGLRSLEFHRVNLEGEAARHLAYGSALANLQAFGLIESHAEVTGLHEAAWLPGLRSLSLVRHHRASRLLESSAWRDLRQVDLDDSYFTDVELARLPMMHFAQLVTHLVLPAAHVGSETLNALVKTRRFSRLQQLELRGYSSLRLGDLAPLRRKFGDRLVFEGLHHLLP